MDVVELEISWETGDIRVIGSKMALVFWSVRRSGLIALSSSERPVSRILSEPLSRS
jgi:hypothetical protein